MGLLYDFTRVAVKEILGIFYKSPGVFFQKKDSFFGVHLL